MMNNDMAGGALTLFAGAAPLAIGFVIIGGAIAFAFFSFFYAAHHRDPTQPGDELKRPHSTL